LGARATFAAATTFVLAATGRTLVTGRFRRGRLDRCVEGPSGVSGLTALTAPLSASLTTSAAAATATSIAAALTLALALALERGRLSVR